MNALRVRQLLGRIEQQVHHYEDQLNDAGLDVDLVRESLVEIDRIAFEKPVAVEGRPEHLVSGDVAHYERTELRRDYEQLLKKAEALDAANAWMRRDIEIKNHFIPPLKFQLETTNGTQLKELLNNRAGVFYAINKVLLERYGLLSSKNNDERASLTGVLTDAVIKHFGRAL